ncbi:MAG TPA: helix-turn-helix domain-containing protein [Thermomicrobiales bacterium]
MVNAEGGGFGERLRHLREAARLTQEELAAKAGLTAKGIAAIERGRRQRPYPNTITALADALNLSDEQRDALIGSKSARDSIPAPAPPQPERVRPALPHPTTPLIGRREEREALAAILADPQVRVVTVTGPGGVGKTRLALAVAGDIAATFPGGVVFATLAALNDPALVPAEIGAAFGLREADAAAVREALRAVLGTHRTCLILDNCEHLLAAVPALADLLSAYPALTILATSRAPLRLRGEREYPLASLTLPSLDRLPTVADLADNPAIDLFVARATDVVPAFTLARANAATIAAICRRVDGLPLALELAAARLRLLSPTDLLARLDRALPLLSGGPRDLPTRQRTMRDTIAWSHDLLTPEEQELFRRLAPFVGVWDFAAAEAVAGEAGSGADTLGLLASLVEQSLVVTETTDEGDSRYRLLIPVREYAQERLAASGEEGVVRLRHAAYYLAFGEHAGPQLEGPQQAAWMRRLEGTHDNVRAAIDWALGAGQHDLVAQLGWALHIFWAMRGHHREGYCWMAATLDGALTPPNEARALAAMGLLARMYGDYAEAIARLSQALERFRSLGDTTATLMTLSRLGHAARLSGDYERAKALALEGLQLARRVGDTARIVWMIDVLGMVAIAEGDHAAAVMYYEEGLPLTRAIGDQRYTNGMTMNLALSALATGQYAKADELSRTALRENRHLGLHRVIAQTLDIQASVAVAADRPHRAARLFAAAETARERETLAPWSPSDRAIYGPYLDTLRAQLAAEHFATSWDQGGAMTIDEAIAYALTADD